ncbi:hypothetical protein [Sphingopyxis sp. 113P3]|uniref:hypothetical protein n=1 Tax=Sphingopyxis sp. (strain 113P3) TaxID=292913 RepID=UPI0006AD4DD4|nr:hypothetical protein [Sphingopyxis sp. 113P3]ALC12498.1 hypothetical protein LH20_11100 [Sphingopyxis sp. 113P3]
MNSVSHPGRYAIDADGRLYSCRGKWRANAVAVVVVKPKRAAEPAPYAPGVKISLRGAPSAMEMMVASWRGKGA